MLHDLETLVGSAVLATDGEIGSVRDFLFDDESWGVRYLVVDVGNWLKKRDVILAITAVEQPDWTKKTFHVRLAKDQVRNSPDVDAEKPVSRQQEIAMRDYWGWMAYWVDKEMGGSVPAPTGVKYPLHTKEDPHLRSAMNLNGYEIWAPDAEIGRLEGFIMDEASWNLGYLNIKGGEWIQSRWVLVPTRWVKSVSWAKRRIDLLHSLEEI
jgi:sporulation protein YlmC with PRC-barrel domain